MKFKHDKILNQCKNKNVLHIGATDYPYSEERAKKGKLLHQKIKKVAKKLVGIDNDRKTIRLLKKFQIKDIYFGDIVKNKYDSKLKKKKFEIIIFGDVIEHLDNPGIALNNLKQYMDDKSKLIITTPNAWSIFNIKNILSKKEKVHPDHTFWPSRITMNNLIQRSNLKIDKFEYILTGSKKDKISFKGKIFRKIFLKNNPHLRSTLYYEIKLNNKK